MKDVTFISKEAFRRLAKINKQKDTADIIVEGSRLITQLADSGIPPKQIYTTPERLITFSQLLPKINAPVQLLTERQANELSQTKQSQGIFATIPFHTTPIKRFKKLIYLNAIADPGNIGTILRTAQAFAIDGVIQDEGCCELSNSKVIRASMGAAITVPTLRVDCNWLAQRKEIIIESRVQGGTPLHNYHFPQQPYIVIIGNEAHGVAPNLSAIATQRVCIPMHKNMESLNAAVTAGLFMYRMSYDN